MPDKRLVIFIFILIGLIIYQGIDLIKKDMKILKLQEELQSNRFECNNKEIKEFLKKAQEQNKKD